MIRILHVRKLLSMSKKFMQTWKQAKVIRPRQMSRYILVNSGYVDHAVFYAGLEVPFYGITD